MRAACGGPTLDAGMVAAQVSKTNKLYEGTQSGDFGNLYPDYSWETDTYEVQTNGLYQVDIVVRRRGLQQPVDSMSILVYSPDSQCRLSAARPSADESRDAPTESFVRVPASRWWRSWSPSASSAWCWPRSIRAGPPFCARSKVGLDAAASAQRARITIRVLEDSLGSAQSFAANLPYYYFDAENGDTPVLSFVARLSKSFPRSGKFGDLDVRRVTFSVEAAPDGSRQLVLRQNPLVMELRRDEKEHPIVLAKNVKGFEMQFWDTEQEPAGLGGRVGGSQDQPIAQAGHGHLEAGGQPAFQPRDRRNHPHHQPAGDYRAADLAGQPRSGRPRDARCAGRSWHVSGMPGHARHARSRYPATRAGCH